MRKKVKLTLFLLVFVFFSITSVFATGTPVFDWSAFIQFAEESYKEYERWETQYNKIMRDIETAEKRFKETDANSFLDMTRYITGSLNDASNLYRDITGKSTTWLMEASEVGFMIENGLQSKYLHDDPGYWISVVKKATVPDTSSESRAQSKVADLEKKQEAIVEKQASTTVGQIQASSDSELDRALALQNAIDSFGTDFSLFMADNAAKEAEEVALSALAGKKNNALSKMFEANIKKGSTDFSASMIEMYPERHYDYFEEDPSTVGLRIQF